MLEKLATIATIILGLAGIVDIADRLKGHFDMRVFLEVAIGITFVVSLAIYLHEKYKILIKDIDYKISLAVTPLHAGLKNEREDRIHEDNFYRDSLDKTMQVLNTRINSVESKIKNATP